MKFKKKLSEKSLERAEKAGFSLGSWIRKKRFFRKIYADLNIIGKRHPKRFIASMVCLNALIFGMSSYFSSPLVSTAQPAEKLYRTIHQDDSIKFYEEQIQAALEDASKIEDSIRTILSKDKLTFEDTLFVVNHGEYVRKIKEIIKQK